MNDEQYERKLSAVREELLERIDKFSLEHRGRWTAGDIVAGGGVLLARSQGHDDIRAFIKAGPPVPEKPESESTYAEPEKI